MHTRRHNLPTRWNKANVTFMGSSEAIFGLSCTSCSYALYLTDFQNLWVEDTQKESLIVKGKQFGFEDLNTNRMKDLVQLLERSTYRNYKISSSSSSEVELALNGDIEWTFKLQKQPESATINFLSDLNRQQFQNHRLLLDKIEGLKRIIEVKDTYSKFLVENFKLSHGMELIADYKRNNKRDVEELDSFSLDLWERKFLMHNQDGDAALTTSLNDHLTWKQANRQNKASTDPDENGGSSHFYSSSPFYTSPIKSKEKLEDHDLAQKPELERSSSASKLDGSPPKKRKKLGVISGLKRTESDRGSIPLLRESIGDLAPDFKEVKKRPKFGSIKRVKK